MKIWINKCVEDPEKGDFKDALVFNVNVPGREGLITSDIREGWYKLLGTKSVSPLSEDLLIISLSVFAADKRISRSTSNDGWTRDLYLSIPVLNFDQWQSSRQDLENMLSFLSGDIWTINFRRCSMENRYISKRKREPIRIDELKNIDAVSLFSGGLDSYCGAFELLSNRNNVAFVSYKEYGKLENIQREIIDDLDKTFPNIKKVLLPFTAKVYAPIGTISSTAENTSRSRSFLFLSAAICVADTICENIPVYIPENGFIGLNLPMTPSRYGSCSTRTTHPYFLRSLNNLLQKIGILHRVINPYAFTTKREMVQHFKDSPGFLNSVSKTISCSHPCNGRWLGKNQPENCGYCYPCLIRQSSLLDVPSINDYYTYNSISYEYVLNATNDRRSDLIDLLSAISLAKSSTDREIIARIKKTGQLSDNEVLSFLELYRATINDLVELFSKDPKLLRVMGIKLI